MTKFSMTSLRNATSVAAIAVAAWATPGFAGCNSGNVANTLLLNDPACPADASGASAKAIDSVAIGNGSLAGAANTVSVGTASRVGLTFGWQADGW